MVATARPVRWRLVNLRKRYIAEGGQASTGSSARIVFHIDRQGAGGFVAAVAVFFQAFHHDPVEFAPEQPAQVPWIDAALCGDRAEIACCAKVDSRVLGRGGSSSRMMRRSSSKGASFRRSLSNGVVPVEQFIQQHA